MKVIHKWILIILFLLVLIAIFLGIKFTSNVRVLRYQDRINVIGVFAPILAVLIGTVGYGLISENKSDNEKKLRKAQEAGGFSVAFASDEADPSEGNEIRMQRRINVMDDLNSDCKLFEDEIGFYLYFLTNKSQLVLKNVMAFGDELLQKQGKAIIDDYYSFCQSIEFSSPQYLVAEPVVPNQNKKDNKDVLEKESLCYLAVHTPASDKSEKSFWISAITDSGTLLFINIISSFSKAGNYWECNLKQQTTYYCSGRKLIPLVGKNTITLKGE